MPKLSNEAQEQMRLAGYDLNDVEGGDLDDHDPDTSTPAQPNAGLDQQEETGSPDTSETELEATEPQEEPGLAPSTEETEQEQEPQEEEPDPNARTWQSKADKAAAELQKEREEKARLKADKEALLAVLSRVGTPAPQAAPNEPEKKKPQLWDFIKEDEYDSVDAAHPGTASGQAKEQYDEALSEWRTEQNIRKHEQLQLQKRMQETATKQAAALAAKHPEFRNPLTDQPNMQKIAEFMDELSNSDEPELWADLYEWRKQRKNGKPATKPTPDLNQIGRNANRVSSVTGQAAGETEKKKVSKSVSSYSSIYGSNLEVPVDAELE